MIACNGMALVMAWGQPYWPEEEGKWPLWQETIKWLPGLTLTPGLNQAIMDFTRPLEISLG